MRRRLLIAILLAGSLLVPLRQAWSQGGDIDADQVRQSIDRGVAYLKRMQHGDGTWPDHAGQVGGVTALCTLALINCGVPIDDEAIQRSLRYLRTLPPKMTYVTSLQTMVLCLAEPQKDLLLIQRNAKWFEETQIKEGPRRGSWAYPGLAVGGDNSNSQFALLGLYEAERAGAKVQERTWQMTLDYWKSAQNASDGSFGYYKGQNGMEAPGTGSMTCAGISSLVIASGRLAAGDADDDGHRTQCCGNHMTDDSAERIERALRWLGNAFTVQQNPHHEGLFGRRGNGQWHFYFLYGVERVGRITARRFIGDHDWYREGAAYLCSASVQQFDGSWKGSDNTEDDPTIATSFSLLFLGKGRRPILVSKLQHGPGNDWNHHRNDIANLTNYAEKKWKNEFPLGMSWQVIDITKASVEDLQQSPVLFINGSEVPDIDEKQGQNLREYVDRGGFIFAEACCENSQGFDDGFKALMKKVFPPEYKLKLLPPEHPVWRAEEIVPPDKQRTLLGLDYGCRTSVIYCPPPGPNDPPNGLSCYWELSSWRDKKYRAPVAAQIVAANSIGINVLAYATNRELKPKEDFFRLAKDKDAQDDFGRGKLYIAKLRHDGGCDTAPAALPHLLEAAARELQIRVSTEQRLIELTDPSLFKYHMVFMHGRRSFSFSAEQREKLRTYIKRGGTLMADAICANREFADSFRREMQAIFAGDRDPAGAASARPLAGSLANRSTAAVTSDAARPSALATIEGTGLVRIPAKDPLFSTEFGGYDLSTVSIRIPSAGDAGQLAGSIRKIEPEFEGIRVGDRWAVIFSKFDLSCALEKHDSLECEGYTRDDAERLGLNVLLYTLHQ
jgi:hypothetical protein